MEMLMPVSFSLEPNLLGLSLASADPFKSAGLKGTLSMSFSKSIILKSRLMELSLFCLAFFREELLVDYLRTGYRHSMTIASCLELSLYGIPFIYLDHKPDTSASSLCSMSSYAKRTSLQYILSQASRSVKTEKILMQFYN